MITDIYASFSTRSRESEHDRYLKTLTGVFPIPSSEFAWAILTSGMSGIVLSLDATFKVTKKAAVVTKVKKEKHDTPMKGGVTSIINEMSEIVAWVSIGYLAHSCDGLMSVCSPQRFCQTQSASEITEMLQGYVERCGLLGVLLALMVIVDNCCHSRNAILAALPLTLVVLDVFHFKQR